MVQFQIEKTESSRGRWEPNVSVLNYAFKMVNFILCLFDHKEIHCFYSFKKAHGAMRVQNGSCLAVREGLSEVRVFG
jgi:hypothetical protein